MPENLGRTPVCSTTVEDDAREGPDRRRCLMADEVAPIHVRLQMRAVAICGSDERLLKNGRMGSSKITEPLVVGHETAECLLQERWFKQVLL
ncbi:hypothetical protein WJX79_006351 [Trebouxia sp. C0005]